MIINNVILHLLKTVVLISIFHYGNNYAFYTEGALGIHTNIGESLTSIMRSHVFFDNEYTIPALKTFSTCNSEQGTLCLPFLHTTSNNEYNVEEGEQQASLQSAVLFPSINQHTLDLTSTLLNTKEVFLQSKYPNLNLHTTNNDDYLNYLIKKEKIVTQPGLLEDTLFGHEEDFDSNNQGDSFMAYFSDALSWLMSQHHLVDELWAYDNYDNYYPSSNNYTLLHTLHYQNKITKPPKNTTTTKMHIIKFPSPLNLDDYGGSVPLSQYEQRLHEALHRRQIQNERNLPYQNNNNNGLHWWNPFHWTRILDRLTSRLTDLFLGDLLNLDEEDSSNTAGGTDSVLLANNREQQQQQHTTTTSTSEHQSGFVSQFQTLREQRINTNNNNETTQKSSDYKKRKIKNKTEFNSKMKVIQPPLHSKDLIQNQWTSITQRFTLKNHLLPSTMDIIPEYFGSSDLMSQNKIDISKTSLNNNNDNINIRWLGDFIIKYPPHPSFSMLNMKSYYNLNTIQNKDDLCIAVNNPRSAIVFDRPIVLSELLLYTQQNNNNNNNKSTPPMMTTSKLRDVTQFNQTQHSLITSLFESQTLLTQIKQNDELGTEWNETRVFIEGFFVGEQDWDFLKNNDDNNNWFYSDSLNDALQNRSIKPVWTIELALDYIDLLPLENRHVVPKEENYDTLITSKTESSKQSNVIVSPKINAINHISGSPYFRIDGIVITFAAGYPAFESNNNDNDDYKNINHGVAQTYYAKMKTKLPQSPDLCLDRLTFHRALLRSNDFSNLADINSNINDINKTLSLSSLTFENDPSPVHVSSPSKSKRRKTDNPLKEGHKKKDPIHSGPNINNAYVSGIIIREMILNNDTRPNEDFNDSFEQQQQKSFINLQHKYIQNYNSMRMYYTKLLESPVTDHQTTTSRIPLFLKEFTKQTSLQDYFSEISSDGILHNPDFRFFGDRYNIILQSQIPIEAPLLSLQDLHILERVPSHKTVPTYGVNIFVAPSRKYYSLHNKVDDTWNSDDGNAFGSLIAVRQKLIDAVQQSLAELQKPQRKTIVSDDSKILSSEKMSEITNKDMSKWQEELVGSIAKLLKEQSRESHYAQRQNNPDLPPYEGTIDLIIADGSTETAQIFKIDLGNPNEVRNVKRNIPSKTSTDTIHQKVDEHHNNNSPTAQHMLDESKINKKKDPTSENEMLLTELFNLLNNDDDDDDDRDLEEAAFQEKSSSTEKNDVKMKNSAITTDKQQQQQQHDHFKKTTLSDDNSNKNSFVVEEEHNLENHHI